MCERNTLNEREAVALIACHLRAKNENHIEVAQACVSIASALDRANLLPITHAEAGLLSYAFCRVMSDTHLPGVDLVGYGELVQILLPYRNCVNATITAASLVSEDEVAE